MSTRTVSLFAVLFALAAPACATEGGPDDGGKDRVTLNNDRTELSRNVTRRNEPVEVEPAAMANGLVLPPSLDWELTLVASVEPPQIDGVPLQATSVSFDGNMAVVSYNMAGAPQQGAVDVFTFDEARQPTLTARAVFADADVHAVEARDGQVWMATGTADETFGTPAVLEVLGVSPEGVLSLDGNQRIGLSSYAATSVSVHGDRVYATSGNTGGVFAFDRLTLTPTGTTTLDDARWVSVAEDGRVVVVQGTPGRVTVLTGSGLNLQSQYNFEGAFIPESKSTVQVLGGKAFVAAGPGGTYIIDINTGAVIDRIGLPEGLPLPASDIVTNAVSVDEQLMFVSNGAAGVYLVQASKDLALPVSDDPTTLQVVGRLGLEDSASVNHITFKDGFLFVATGLGGLKIVRVAPEEIVVEPPTGYPYVSDLESDAARAGWAFSGDWGFGATDGERVAKSGTVFIDSDPSGADQYNHGTDNVALLDVPLAIPAVGNPALEFWYNVGNLVHVNDAYYVEVENPTTGAWDIKKTLINAHSRADLSFAQIQLDAYKGQTVRVRLRQRMGKEHGARRFVVDDVRVGEMTAPLLSWPLVTGFDAAEEQAQWAYEGAWKLGDDAVSGEAALSVNPDGTSQASYVNHTATLLGFVPVPAAGRATLSFAYRSDLTHDNDKIDLDVQVQGESTWADLHRFSPVHDHLGWTQKEIDLSKYAGKAIRVRWHQSFGDADAPRTFVVDDLSFGAGDEAELPYPFTTSFEQTGELAGWSLAGQWSVTTDAATGTVALDANPHGIAQGGYGAGQEATMLAYVVIPAGAPAALTFNYRLGLVDAADRAYVELQTADSSDWRLLETFQPQHNRASWSTFERSLDEWAGQAVRVRFRFSYAHTPDVRTLAIDDVRLGGLSDERHAWPYRATFVADEELDAWILNGSFVHVTDGERGAIIDANAYGVPQGGQSKGHRAMMRGFVTVPTAGVPTLSVAMRFALGHADDKVYVQLQDVETGKWTTVRTFTAKHDHPAFSVDEIPLDSYLGRTVRVGITYAFANVEAARTLQIDDVTFGPLVLDAYAYPFHAAFEPGGDAAAWNLWGAWALSAAHGEAAPADGLGFLDGNPGEQLLDRYDTYQTATMNGFVTLPSDVPSHAGFTYRFDALYPADRLEVELQTTGSSDWTSLLTLDRQHARGDLAQVDLPLGAWAGQSVRLRLRMVLGASVAVRTIAIDELWIAPLAGPTFASPYAADFATPSADWQLHGTWDFTSDGWLSSNPDALPQYGYATQQTATLDGFIDLTGVAVPVLALDYALALAHASDRAYVEVQGLSDSTWTKLRTFTVADNTTGPATATLPLAAFAGRQVRVRFSYKTAQTDQVREFAVRLVACGGAL